ncbi:hypothetical protein ABTE31_21660, partial [Acinetobacter baumannii]
LARWTLQSCELSIRRGRLKMTRGERFVAQLPGKARFHDRNERRSYAVARLVAAHLIDRPELVQHGRAYMERHMRADP